MAKVFYVTETANDYSTAHFFKTEKEALKYGKSKVKDFNMKQDMWGDGFHDEENDTWFGGEWINTQYGILMSWEEDRVYIQSADDEEARKFIRSSRHDKQGSAIFFDSFKKGMHGSLGNDFAEGEGYTWKHHRKEYIKESKTIMKHIKLFEQFINEAKVDATQFVDMLQSLRYELEREESAEMSDANMASLLGNIWMESIELMNFTKNSQYLALSSAFANARIGEDYEFYDTEFEVEARRFVKKAFGLMGNSLEGAIECHMSAIKELMPSVKPAQIKKIYVDILSEFK